MFLYLQTDRQTDQTIEAMCECDMKQVRMPDYFIVNNSMCDIFQSQKAKHRPADTH